MSPRSVLHFSPAATRRGSSGERTPRAAGGGLGGCATWPKIGPERPRPGARTPEEGQFGATSTRDLRRATSPTPFHPLRLPPLFLRLLLVQLCSLYTLPPPPAPRLPHTPRSLLPPRRSFSSGPSRPGVAPAAGHAPFPFHGGSGGSATTIGGGYCLCRLRAGARAPSGRAAEQPGGRRRGGQTGERWAAKAASADAERRRRAPQRRGASARMATRERSRVAERPGERPQRHARVPERQSRVERPPSGKRSPPSAAALSAGRLTRPQAPGPRWQCVSVRRPARAREATSAPPHGRAPRRAAAQAVTCQCATAAACPHTARPEARRGAPPRRPGPPSDRAAAHPVPCCTAQHSRAPLGRQPRTWAFL